MGDEAPAKEIQTPDHTRLQVVAVAQAVIAAVVAFGVPITNQQSIALVALAGVIGAALVTADASIRRERARNADKLRPRMDVTQTSEVAGQKTTASVSAPLDAGDSAESYAHVLELLAAVEKIRAVLQPPPPASSQNRGISAA